MNDPLVLGRPLPIHHRVSQSGTENGRGEPNAAAVGSDSYPAAVQNPEHKPSDHRGAADQSDSSDNISVSSTARPTSDDQIREKRSKDLGNLSHNQLRRAAIAGSAAPDAGGAAAAVLARDAQPDGWRQVDVDDKHHLWSAKISRPRRSALKKVLLLFAFITVWLWVCLSIFWGSTYSLERYFPKLNTNLVTFDTDSASFLNGPMIQMARSQEALPSSSRHLGWSVRDASEFPNGLEDVRNNVLSQRSWATVVINQNATTAWRNAIANGDASYYPNGAISIYIQTARFYQVSLLYVEAILQQNLQQPLSSARAAALRSFTSDLGGSGTTIANAAAVPQAIGVGFGYSIIDLKYIENGAWSGAAPMEAAMIYYVIFAFYIALFGGIARMKSTLATKLQFRSMLRLRLLWPLGAYFIMSLWFTLIERAWQIPVSSQFGSAGFMVLWMLNYVTLIAAGFALETMLSLLGVAWLPFFLILWIILNITSSFYPLDIMPRFYHFLQWTPFIRNIEGFKIIAYGTDLKHRLGLHFGVLFALIGLELICLPLAILFERWSSDRTARKEQEKGSKVG